MMPSQTGGREGVPAPFHIGLAGQVIKIEPFSRRLRSFCRDYLTDGPGAFSIRIEAKDIAFEREKAAREDAIEGIPPRRFSDAYLETLAAYRKIAENLLEYDTLLCHGSTIAVDGLGYLFTARSGTGKSTHTRLWRERFGSRAVMVNDDKPLLKVTGGGVLAYGTPWDGKHHLSENISVPLKAICILERSETNHIQPISGGEACPMLLQQIHRPAEADKLIKTLSLADALLKQVKFYRLGCNQEPSAAQVAYDGMQDD